MSNHSVISLEINLNKIKHGEGYFKFNSSLVLHPEYQHKIRNVIKETVDINKNTNIVSEYDQEIPQSQTAYIPMSPRGRAAQPSWDTRTTY